MRDPTPLDTFHELLAGSLCSARLRGNGSDPPGTVVGLLPKAKRALLAQLTSDDLASDGLGLRYVGIFGGCLPATESWKRDMRRFEREVLRVDPREFRRKYDELA